MPFIWKPREGSFFRRGRCHSNARTSVSHLRVKFRGEVPGKRRMHFEPWAKEGRCHSNSASCKPVSIRPMEKCRGAIPAVRMPFGRRPKAKFGGGAIPTAHAFCEPGRVKIYRRKVPFQRSFLFVIQKRVSTPHTFCEPPDGRI